MPKLPRWLRSFFEPPTPDPKADPVARTTMRRQRAIADRLSKITGEPTEALLDYRQADRIIGAGRNG